MTRRIFSLFLLGAFCLATTEAEARLPKPIKADGIVLAVDLDSQTLVLKSAKGKKPMLLDWDKQTEFIRNDQHAAPGDLKQGAPVVIYYKDLSFRNPLLKKLIWTDASAAR